MVVLCAGDVSVSNKDLRLNLGTYRNGISGFHESKPGKPGDMMAGEVLCQVRWSEESLRRVRSFLDGASQVKLTKEEEAYKPPGALHT